MKCAPLTRPPWAAPREGIVVAPPSGRDGGGGRRRGVVHAQRTDGGPEIEFISSGARAFLREPCVAVARVLICIRAQSFTRCVGKATTNSSCSISEKRRHFILYQRTGARGGAVGGAMMISLRVALALALALAVIAATEAAANVQFESAANQGDISSSDSWSASTTSGAQAQAVAGVVPVLLSLAVCGIVLLAQCL